MAELFCIIETKEEIVEKIKQVFEYIRLNCFCCYICWHCSVVRELRKESIRVGIETFNSDMKYWSIEWVRNKHNEYIPRLKYYDLDGANN